MSRRLIAVLAGGIVVPIIVAGCGGGGNDNSTTSLTKPEFVKKADAICASGEKEIEADFESFSKEHHLSNSKPPSKAVAEEAANTIPIPNIERQVEEIRALGAPKGESQQVDELLGAVEAAIEKAKQDPAAFIEGEGENVFSEANKMARDYGLEVCGQE